MCIRDSPSTPHQYLFIVLLFHIVQSCYRLSRELKTEEMRIKDRITELKQSLEHAKEKKREVLAHKGTISKGKYLYTVLYDASCFIKTGQSK